MNERSQPNAVPDPPGPPISVRYYQLNNLNRKTQLATRMEVAGTGAARSKGLLGRKGLEPGEALWIVPCEAVHTFFMQFAIDLVYIDKQNRVRKVKNCVPPWRLSACFLAHSVIELPAGVVHHSETQTGDVLEFVPLEAKGEGPVTGVDS
jgi:uncharacterized protein